MKDIIIKLKKILNKRDMRKLFYLFLMMLVSAVLEVFGITLMIPMVTTIINPNIITENEVIAKVCATFSISSHKTFAIVCVVSMIAIYIVKNLYLMLQIYLQTKEINNSMFQTQCRVLHSFMMRPYEYFLNASDGEIITVVQKDVPSVYSLLTTCLNMLTEAVISLAIVITMIIVDPVMTVTAVAVISILVLVITRVMHSFLDRFGRQSRHNEAQQSKWLLQAINGIKDVKIGCKEEFFENQYVNSGRKYLDAINVFTVWNNMPRLIVEMVSVSVLLGYVGISIWLGTDSATLIPTLAAFGMGALKLLPSANKIINAYNSMVYTRPALNKVYENLDGWLEESDEMRELANRLRSENEKITFHDSIKINQLKYHYPNTDKWILNEADVEFPIGQSIGVVGKSGAGKTTLVDLLLGLLSPQSGEISVDDQDIMSAYREWLSHIGYIPQNIFMMDGSIRENVVFGSVNETDDEKVWKALEEAQLADFVESLPEGLDTQIGQRGIRISGGQRQRLGIARALFDNPDVLVFDEATSSLDNETEAAIMESINSLHGKKTMIIIAHRLQTIEGCDVVYRVESGKVTRER